MHAWCSGILPWLFSHGEFCVIVLFALGVLAIISILHDALTQQKVSLSTASSNTATLADSNKSEAEPLDARDKEHVALAQGSSFDRRIIRVLCCGSARYGNKKQTLPSFSSEVENGESEPGVLKDAQNTENVALISKESNGRHLDAARPSREPLWDIAKFVLMCFVEYDHFRLPNREYYYSFYMTCFSFVSGIVTQGRVDFFPLSVRRRVRDFAYSIATFSAIACVLTCTALVSWDGFLIVAWLWFIWMLIIANMVVRPLFLCLTAVCPGGKTVGSLISVCLLVWLSWFVFRNFSYVTFYGQSFFTSYLVFCALYHQIFFALGLAIPRDRLQSFLLSPYVRIGGIVFSASYAALQSRRLANASPAHSWHWLEQVLESTWSAFGSPSFEEFHIFVSIACLRVAFISRWSGCKYQYLPRSKICRPSRKDYREVRSADIVLLLGTVLVGRMRWV
eukprot:TRINITY_DN9776_c0_g1_i1.p1 TRINITY_DN9776_c0_g1~~TRINITY_DN9776_c0_g1_i1.p1  ORF type:complete len:451 (-),score=23.17 TRINITY_DN9776_c0_g1_i1:197-1549(-)